jgi:hypothetical protein
LEILGHPEGSVGIVLQQADRPVTEVAKQPAHLTIGVAMIDAEMRPPMLLGPSANGTHPALLK